jgi:hypothetical protein
MSFDTEEYTAVTGDDNQTSTVRAHFVTKEEAGQQVETTAGVQQVQEGTVLVETSRPDRYDILTKEQWDASGYGKEKDSPAPVPAHAEDAPPLDGTDNGPDNGGV